jgi:phosphoesterase RecJ-like protein
MRELEQEFEKAKKLLVSAKRVFLTTHVDTHGDDIGALLPMKHALEKMGKMTVGVSPGDIPPYLVFLPGLLSLSKEIPPLADFDVVITFGCQRPERASIPELLQFRGHTINIDEHADNTHWAEVNVVQDGISSTSELTYHLLIALGVAIDRDMATCLLTGIFTETGRFQHANTTPEVLTVAAELLKRGVRIDRIARHTYSTKGIKALKAFSYAIDKAVLDSERGLVFCVLTDKEMQKLGVTEPDFDGLVETLNTIPEARFALVLKQIGGTIKGSLRSEEYKGVDVGKLARLLGGGGHRLAAGFEIKGSIVQENGKYRIL